MFYGILDNIIVIGGIIIFLLGFAWNIYDSYIRKDCIQENQGDG